MDKRITAGIAGCALGLVLALFVMYGSSLPPRLPATSEKCQTRLPDASFVAFAEVRASMRGMGGYCEALTVHYHDDSTGVFPLPDTRWFGRPL